MILWFITLLSNCVASNGPTLSVEPSVIAPGEHARVEVRLAKTIDSIGTADTMDPLMDSRLVEESGLNVLNSEFYEQDQNYHWNWEVTAYLPGTIAFPALAVNYGDKSYSTERKEILVTGNDNSMELLPSYPEVSVPIPWLYILRLGVSFGLVSLLLGILISSRNKPKHHAVPKISPSPEQWLRTELERQLNHPCAHPLQDYLFAMHEYFYRTQIHLTPCKTTGELSKLQHTKILPHLSTLARCDRFRFSGTKENEATMISEALKQTLCSIA